MGYAIETTGLTRRFGDLTAVDNLTLDVKKGELFGFLGPNGAGKTTAIRMLTTLLSPTAGSARVGGFDVIGDASRVRGIIGVVPQQFALFDELTPIENMQYIGRLYGMGEGEILRKSREFLDVVELWDKRGVPAGGFSGGMKQRLSVAAGLLHEPQILFMDEPTTGLDPHSRIALRELTRKLNKENGITVVYTTHDMEEADKLCDRIGIMDKARMVDLDTPAKLKERIPQKIRVEIRVAKGPGNVAETLKKQAFVSAVRPMGARIELEMRNGQDSVCEMNRYFYAHGIVLSDMRVRETSLEDVFIHLTSGEQ
ncbi:MAG: ATP-binding cassette domain-containing protein [Candidatus Micrarchaeota archaeon]|nr:ATP-binding cassette domain-containing protein [Candidatus Micrarchaeota archaeon]